MSCSGFPTVFGSLSRLRFSSAVVLLASFLAGCGGTSDDAPTASISGGNSGEAVTTADSTAVAPQALSADYPLPSGGVVIEQPAPPPPPPQVEISTSQGVIRVELFRDEAPVTVENFLANYVSPGFYAGTILHYVDDGFMIAGGGYTADLQPKETQAQIFNEARQDLKNLKGTIAMVRHPEHVNSATSQFFFNLVDNPGLDHEGTEEGQQFGYCVFGKVVAGMDVLERIAQVDVRDTEMFRKLPVEPIVIESVTRVR